MTLFFWNKHKAKTFKNQTVYISRRSFERCEFISCKIVYTGGPVRMSNSVFRDCSFVFEGKAGTALSALFKLSKLSPELLRLTLLENGFGDLLFDQTPPGQDQ